VGDTLILLLNAHYEAIPFTLPSTKGNLKWQVLVDTAASPATGGGAVETEKYELKGRSMVVLVVPRVPAEEPTNGNGKNAAAAKTPGLPGTADNSGVAAGTAARDLKGQRDKEKATA
jgi:isoamylase